MNLLDHLNPPQRQATEHRDGPLLILAGAGSGKTRVITYRIAWLILEAGVYPEQILAVTFTNKAAGEMRERVDAILEAHGASADAAAVTISTFHSFCARLLRRHADRLGLDGNFNIYDSDDQLKLVKQVMEQLDRPKDRSEARRLRGYINRMKNQGYTPEHAHENAFSPMDEENATFYERYQQVIREGNCADFGDLILGVLEIFRDDPRLADSYSRHWRYLMVDEFQDTNPAQYELLEHLTRQHDNLAVVGDDDQAIYRWRGATVANILGFEKDFEGARVVKLEQNYRSTNVILEAANDVIQHNPTRRDKRLWTEREGGEKITVFTGGDDREEASFVARRIHELAKAGADWGDFAVFYRTNAQSRQFEEQLQNWGVPYQVIGGISFYERAEIKDVLGYLKVALNPENEVDFLRAVNTPSRGIGKVTVQKLQRAARVPGVGTMYRALRYAAGRTEPAAVGDMPVEPDPRHAGDDEALAQLDSLRGVSSSGVEELCELLVSLRDQIASDEGLSQVATFLIDSINYMSHLANDDPERAEDRQRNVAELLGAMEEFEEDFDERDLELAADTSELPEGTERIGESRLSQLLRAFLDRSALVHSTDQMDEKGAVTLMTVHGAKGLEFDTVFLSGMEDEIFPSIRDQADTEELHEERRLAYVAITRARHKLYITNARRRRIYGKTRRTEPSRFLLDIDPARIEIDAQSSSQRIAYGSRSRRRSSKGGYDAFRQATEKAYFGDGVDEDLWEFDQSPPMYKNRVSDAAKKALDEAPDDDEFDTSFSQIEPWDDANGEQVWSETPDPASASDGDGLTGCTISHSRFGIGKVVSASGSGDKAVLTIDFPGKGEKTIIRKFVKVLG